MVKEYCKYKEIRVKSGKSKSGKSRRSYNRRNCLNTGDQSSDTPGKCLIGMSKSCVLQPSGNETLETMETRRRKSRDRRRSRVRANSKCAGRDRFECNTPCLWASGDVRQYCRAPQKFNEPLLNIPNDTPKNKNTKPVSNVLDNAQKDRSTNKPILKPSDNVPDNVKELQTQIYNSLVKNYELDIDPYVYLSNYTHKLFKDIGRHNSKKIVHVLLLPIDKVGKYVPIFFYDPINIDMAILVADKWYSEVIANPEDSNRELVVNMLSEMKQFKSVEAVDENIGVYIFTLK
jgi:hypothetical protein